MPRIQVNLPVKIYEQVKSRGIPVSELLQGAVKTEIRRLDLLAETDAYLRELIAETGVPTAAQRAHADAIAARIVRAAGPQGGASDRARPRFRRKPHAR
jgi:post-segregation antitoxin (ccd killing protein)